MTSSIFIKLLVAPC